MGIATVYGPSNVCLSLIPHLLLRLIMAVKNLDRWIRGAVESFFEMKLMKDQPVTREFVAGWLDMTSKEKDWEMLGEKTKLACVGKELGRLRRNKKLEEVPPNEIIYRGKLYRKV
jgi:hypothetical protein